ncbi:MAG: response regulator, partial [candidate division KSB1 bacterium]|nr:response regulator [candidate division KSB1 bacterium]
MKILIVEDDKDYAFLEQEVLEETLPGCQIEVAPTGQDCLTKNLSDYDVILLDYHLPDTPGIELIPKILNRCDVPVIMVTGVQEVETVVEALKSGAYNYTVKSHETLTLLPAIIEKTIEEYKRKGYSAGEINQIVGNLKGQNTRNLPLEGSNEWLTGKTDSG